MKTLNQYIKESLQSKAIYNESILDDEEDLISSAQEEIVREFISENYSVHEPALVFNKENGKIVINCIGNIRVKNKKLKQLTNGLFEWGVVDSFICEDCESLKSLEGAPKGAIWFNCSYCNSLTTLEGAPEKCRTFICSYCNSLKSLEGAPEKVIVFDCTYCDSLKTLKGGPKDVDRDFKCNYCTSLKDLTGAPKKVGGWFNCRGCGKKFTKEDVEKISKVNGRIII